MFWVSECMKHHCLAVKECQLGMSELLALGIDPVLDISLIRKSIVINVIEIYWVCH